MLRTILLLLLVGTAMGACAPEKMYNWGRYEDSLLSYYKDPEKIDGLMTALDTAIVNGNDAKRVPPGIFAEYAYLLMIRNQNDEAIQYFRKEKAAWPESAAFMDKMIAFAKQAEKRAKSSGKRRKGQFK